MTEEPSGIRRLGPVHKLTEAEITKDSELIQRGKSVVKRNNKKVKNLLGKPL